MKEIALTQGKVALVDDEDFESLSKFQWNGYRGGNTFYAQRYICLNNTTIHLLMHRCILKLNNNDMRQVDHKNGNGLDNRKENLRIATSSQNQANSQKRIDNTSGYKGVTWNKRNKKWQAEIKYNQQHFYLGLFKNKDKAAQAYNEMALKFHGEFARLNIILGA